MAKVSNFFAIIAVIVMIVGIIIIDKSIRSGYSITLGPDDSVTPKDICAGLSAEDCFANDNCEGQYGGDCNLLGMCTESMHFQSCIPSGLTSDEIQEIKSECEKIGGKYIKDRFQGSICRCNDPDESEKTCLTGLIAQMKKD